MMEAEDLFFEAFANRSRFNILKELNGRELCAGELQKILGIEQTNLSHNLRCLLNCKFINVRKEGRKRIYSITPDVRQIVDEILKHIKDYEAYLERCEILKKENDERV
ncbi:MAG: metalloregulator ArsR/SmtB family transcription factor [Candidatus Parvarchaeota archaeon]|nr:metalloregulator ArsR/SmtB family transcription factor [Candidatus Parvarchaeota archaeon]MCW1301804.1 metalloregulator ArsR/SmtB family transcription factor [Candidatus Parvarchaeota archaeon]